MSNLVALLAKTDHFVSKIRIIWAHFEKLAVPCNQGSIQLSLSQAKADPSIAWARITQLLKEIDPTWSISVKNTKTNTQYSTKCGTPVLQFSQGEKYTST